jgi:cell division protein ZapA
MAAITATINGRQFRLGCEDGEEEHLQALAQSLEDRVVELHGKFGEIGDTRLTVMAALTIADDLVEANKRIRRLEEELTALQDARVLSSERAKEASAAVVGAFNSAAERLEGITRKLNSTLTSAAAVG